MHETKAFMSPFLGTDEERQALAAWLASLSTDRHAPLLPVPNQPGRQIP